MEVVTRVVENGSKFFYQRGRVSTTIPWLRPTYNRVKSFFNKLEEDSNLLEEYEVYMLGGVLFDFNTTWDLDIGLIGKEQNNEKIEQDINYITDLALNKYRILADVNWYSARLENLTPTKLQESGNFHQDVIARTVGYIKKQIDEDIQEIDLRKRKDISNLTEFLIEQNLKNFKYKQKVLDKVHTNKNQTTITTFSVNEFLRTDENYFLTHTNR